MVSMTVASKISQAKAIIWPKLSYVLRIWQAVDGGWSGVYLLAGPGHPLRVLRHFETWFRVQGLGFRVQGFGFRVPG